MFLIWFVLQVKSELERAEKLFDEGDSESARRILAPLIQRNNGAAIRMDCSRFDPGMSEAEMEQKYVEGMVRSADCGDLEALYTVGAFYDIGARPQIPQDKAKASEIFKKAADRGHAHSMWIHATELLWGTGSFVQSIDEGARYLDLAIESGSAEACITKAQLLLKGELGFERDQQRANELRKRAKKFDDSVFDPFG